MMSHFNKEAANWDEPQKIEMMKSLAIGTQQALKLSPSKKLDILDFGCGTGLFGLEFTDYANSILGIDTSSGMLDVFDQKTKDSTHFKSLNIDLEHESLENKKFDLIISSMTFHHLEKPSVILKKLKKMLNPDGKIAIVDLNEEDGTFHPDNEGMGVKHFGFSKDELNQWAVELGLSFHHEMIFEKSKNEKNYPIFLAVYS